MYRITAGGKLEQYADFSALAGGIGNDLYVSPAGDAYAGNFGFALGEEDPKPTHLVHIRADGSVSQVPGDLIFPNGCARTPMAPCWSRKPSRTASARSTWRKMAV